MIQAIISTIVELVALMFAMAAGAFLEGRGKPDSKQHTDFAIMACIFLSLLLAASALGVASR
jgi:hypothetical protein